MLSDSRTASVRIRPRASLSPVIFILLSVSRQRFFFVAFTDVLLGLSILLPSLIKNFPLNRPVNCDVTDLDGLPLNYNFQNS